MQVVPGYSAKTPVEPVKVRAEVRLSTSNSPEIEKLVVVAFVEVEVPVMFKLPITVEEAVEM